MKIEILDATSPGTGTPFVLFAGALDSPEDPLEASHEDTIQIAQGLRATAVKVFNRTNTVFTLPLQRTVDYGSINAAEKALIDYPSSVPRTGIFRFTPENAAGGGGDIRWGVDGTVHKFVPRLIGCAIIWKFQITCGQLTATQPY